MAHGYPVARVVIVADALGDDIGGRHGRVAIGRQHADAVLGEVEAFLK